MATNNSILLQTQQIRTNSVNHKLAFYDVVLYATRLDMHNKWLWKRFKFAISLNFLDKIISRVSFV